MISLHADVLSMRLPNLVDSLHDLLMAMTYHCILPLPRHNYVAFPDGFHNFKYMHAAGPHYGRETQDETRERIHCTHVHQPEQDTSSVV